MSLPMPHPAKGLPLGVLVRELGRSVARLFGDPEVCVTDVRQDSRRVEPGDLFVARAGGKVDGSRFVVDAARRGAAAVLTEHGAALEGVSLPVIRVDDAKVALSFAAEAVHGHPSRALRVTGITGTNGKTTTAWLAERAIEAAGGAAARLGTLGYSFHGDVIDESLTTPEADDISRIAARALSRGATDFVMEVSSIALVQARVEALSFAVAAFSNLTQDHLDFHGTMAEYARAKARLFTELSPAASVLFADDPFGAELSRKARGKVLTVGRSADCSVRALETRIDRNGIFARVATPTGEVTLDSRLVGAHNLENLLLALGITVGLGLDPEKAAEGLSAAGAAPGRLERCDGPADDVTVVVDYAHTPDALVRVLHAVRSLGPGKVHCVFGCGGDRDPDKRPKMGAAVAELADRATITNDNPRTEDPAAIAAAIDVGFVGFGTPYEIELDREAAIREAIAIAAPGDVVLLAGKGHETYQIIGTEKRHFDDREVARDALQKRRGGSG
ncbi:MAG TPA: UDP-N-acetylmuramoyl-L-alanyl-D-glutamate--2,6-diaminopimelate ligase [Polyangiaceae bacterium]|nr:UDP-N-acetylmuramoyl-L-alanyl-D-glutamate--2,6-diaminopimelate ligase [Polyangiaceae bacterium]